MHVKEALFRAFFVPEIYNKNLKVCYLSKLPIHHLRISNTLFYSAIKNIFFGYVRSKIKFT